MDFSYFSFKVVYYLFLVTILILCILTESNNVKIENQILSKNFDHNLTLQADFFKVS